MDPLTDDELQIILDRISNHVSKSFFRKNIMLKYETKDLPEDDDFEDAINDEPTKEINDEIFDKAAKIIAKCLFDDLKLKESEIDKNYEDYVDAFYSAIHITLYFSGLIKILCKQKHIKGLGLYSCNLSEDDRNEFLKYACLIFRFRAGDGEFINEDVFNAYRKALYIKYEENN